MSSNSKTKELIEKHLYKLERNGINVRAYLLELLNKFEDEKESTDETNANVVSLLADVNAQNMCAKGHTLDPIKWIHLRGLPCSQCEDTNRIKRSETDAKEIETFLNEYDVSHPPSKSFGWWFEKNNFHDTYPLHYAATNNDIVSIRKICKKSRSHLQKKMPEWYNHTPLNWASSACIAAVVELIKYGAEPFTAPNLSQETNYCIAAMYKKTDVVQFYHRYAMLKYNVNIKNKMFECIHCYGYDYRYHNDNIDSTMRKYVYCSKCTTDNVTKIQQKMDINSEIEKTVIQTLKQNPQISVDTLCGMRDKKSLEYLLKDVVISGDEFFYLLFLFDIDNFKAINSALTHHGADIKLQQIGEILKKYERKTAEYWEKRDIAAEKLWTFRQGGDEFAMVVKRKDYEKIDPEQYTRYHKFKTIQLLYESIRNEINAIKIEKLCYDKNKHRMTNIQLSVGVYIGDSSPHEQWLKKSDEAAEIVKNNGKNGIRLVYQEAGKCQVFKSFYDFH